MVIVSFFYLLQVPAQKGVNLNSFLSYKSTADIACTSSSTCQIIHYGGNVMGNKSSSLNVIEMGKTLLINMMSIFVAICLQQKKWGVFCSHDIIALLSKSNEVLSLLHALGKEYSQSLFM